MLELDRRSILQVDLESVDRIGFGQSRVVFPRRLVKDPLLSTRIPPKCVVSIRGVGILIYGQSRGGTGTH